MLRFVIEDGAVAYGRMIPVRTGRYTRMVKPPRQRIYQEKVQMEAYRAYHAQRGADAPLLDEPMILSVRVYRPIPKGWSKRKSRLAAEGRIRPTVKPDLDNFLKLLLDGMTGVVWRDDALVVGYERTGKFYTADRPRTEVRIWTLQELWDAKDERGNKE